LNVFVVVEVIDDGGSVSVLSAYLTKQAAERGAVQVFRDYAKNWQSATDMGDTDPVVLKVLDLCDTFLNGGVSPTYEEIRNAWLEADGGANDVDLHEVAVQGT
jgi:hypoxanthine phosphoribosyltransferase